MIIWTDHAACVTEDTRCLEQLKRRHILLDICVVWEVILKYYFGGVEVKVSDVLSCFREGSMVGGRWKTSPPPPPAQQRRTCLKPYHEICIGVQNKMSCPESLLQCDLGLVWKVLILPKNTKTYATWSDPRPPSGQPGSGNLYRLPTPSRSTALSNGDQQQTTSEHPATIPPVSARFLSCQGPLLVSA
jgi:hypothetical protein